MIDKESVLNKQRPFGQLERKGVEPLPPTPVSEAAKERLLRWGLREEQISQLQDFCAGFRYDRCLEKVERLTKQPVFLERADETTAQARIPFFFDMQGRMDGQCGDIARQFLVQGEFSNLFSELNALTPLEDDHEIFPAFCTGRSKTHFCKEGDNHFWNGLSLVKNTDQVVDSILIDAAFQTIVTPEESGYILDTNVLHPTGFTAFQLHVTVPLGSVRKSWDGFEITDSNSIVLGLSNDRKYAYTLGFLESKDLQQQSVWKSVRTFFGGDDTSSTEVQIVPMLVRIPASGRTERFLLHPVTSELSKNRHSVLTEEEEQEISEILNECKNFTFSTEMNDFPGGAAQAYHYTAW